MNVVRSVLWVWPVRLMRWWFQEKGGEGRERVRMKNGGNHVGDGGVMGAL